MEIESQIIFDEISAIVYLAHFLIMFKVLFCLFHVQILVVSLQRVNQRYLTKTSILKGFRSLFRKNGIALLLVD